jgi:hypothetical protein
MSVMAPAAGMLCEVRTIGRCILGQSGRRVAILAWYLLVLHSTVAAHNAFVCIFTEDDLD